ncbi:MAG: FtsQ-type POTRA domain-containing protein [Oscillospiraceae bacterium]|nr:FtsQ-type POTRA domain-containing protein [Oscillospiraceae bacterium]
MTQKTQKSKKRVSRKKESAGYREKVFDLQHQPPPRKLTNPYATAEYGGNGKSTQHTAAQPSKNMQSSAAKKKKPAKRLYQESSTPQLYNQGEKPNYGREQQSIQRRISHAEARRRRRMHRIMLAIFILILLVVGFSLSVTVLFKIEGYRIEGESIYSQEEIIAAFGHPLEENIFQYKTAEVELEMGKQLPYLDEIKVRRSLPGTIVFKLTPAVEKYYIESEGEYRVLSGSLKVLRSMTEEPANLCKITGAELANVEFGTRLVCATQEQTDTLTTLLEGLETQQLEPVSQINIGDVYEIYFVYQDRFKVLLGTVSNMELKLKTLAYIVENKLDEHETGLIDVSRAAAGENAKTTVRNGNLAEILAEDVPQLDRQEENQNPQEDETSSA